MSEVDARRVDESGVFPTVRVREVDVGILLVGALEMAARSGLTIEIDGPVIRKGEAIVLGDRDRLSKAFAKVVSTCVGCMERGAVLRVALRRDLLGWSVSIDHSLRRHIPLDDGVDELAFARSVLLGHDGAFVMRTDPVRRVRVLVASLPPVCR